MKRLFPGKHHGQRLDDPPTPSCDDSQCHWAFPLLQATAKNGSPDGYFEVDGADVYYRPNDGRGLRFAIDTYATILKQTRKALSAAQSDPHFVRFCKQVRQDPARQCAAWLEQPGSGTCSKTPSADDECLWQVYAGELTPSHASRFATYQIDPGTWRIVAVQTLCGPRSAAEWRRLGPSGACASP
jgi:hypothetical protein